jgi:hypothetical protein
MALGVGVTLAVANPAQDQGRLSSRPQIYSRSAPILDIGPPLPEQLFPSPLPPRRPHREVSQKAAARPTPTGTWRPWPHGPAAGPPSVAEIDAMIAQVFGTHAAAGQAVADCESGDHWWEQNPSGASGVFQEMPSWWWDSAAGKELWDPFDPMTNIRAAYTASSGGTDWSAWVCKP